MRKISIDGFTRISKKAAFKAYKEGKTVYLCPVNFSPVSMWFQAVPLHNDSPRKWENIINEFEFYNCTNNESGRYTAFYIKEVA